MVRSISDGENNVDNFSLQNLPEVNGKTRPILRNMIYQQIDEIRTGMAYVEHELQADCYSRLLTDDDIYSKFEVMTGKNWLDVDIMSNHESGLSWGKLMNIKKEQYVGAIRAASDFVRRMIELYYALHESPTKQTGGQDAHHNTDVDTVSSLSESESKVWSSSRKRKKKSKKSKNRVLENNRLATLF